MAHTILDIGIAHGDITPPPGVTLSGYGTRDGQATGVDHPLRAEALVCRGDGGEWALLTSDVVGYPGGFVDEVRALVAARCDLTAGHVCISATHTHSGPAGQRTYPEPRVAVDDEYRTWLVERLAEVVVEARAAARPGSFEAAWTRAPELGHNRRVVENGVCRNEWEDLDGTHTGLFDPTVMLVGVRRADGALDALIVNYGCHPVTLGPANLRISADYVGYLKGGVEAAGVAGTVLFALSAAADINPRVAIRTGAAAPRSMGECLARIVVDAVPRLQPLAGGPVRCVTEPWIFEREREGEVRRVATSIQALRAGDLAVAAVPGELFSAYAQRFRDASPLPATLVVSMANGAVGYLPLDAAYPQGGLEVMRAACDAVEAPVTAHVTRALASLV